MHINGWNSYPIGTIGLLSYLLILIIYVIVYLDNIRSDYYISINVPK